MKTQTIRNAGFASDYSKMIKLFILMCAVFTVSSGKYCPYPTCRNGGTCYNEKHNGKCRCTDGWSGQSCDTDVNECLLFPCMNDGSCVNTQGSYTCLCDDMYTGKNCDTVVGICDLSKIEFDIYNLPDPTQMTLEFGETLQVQCVQNTSRCDCSTKQTIMCSNGTVELDPCSVDGPCCAISDDLFATANVVVPDVSRMDEGSIQISCLPEYFLPNCDRVQDLTCTANNGTSTIGHLTQCSSTVCNVDNINFTGLNLKPLSDFMNCVPINSSIKVECLPGFVNTDTNTAHFYITCDGTGNFTNLVTCKAVCDLADVDFLGKNVSIPEDKFVQNEADISLTCVKGSALPDCKEEQIAKCVNGYLSFKPCSRTGPCCHIDIPELIRKHCDNTTVDSLDIGEWVELKCSHMYHTSNCQTIQKVMCYYDHKHGGAKLQEIWPCKCKGHIYEYGHDCQCLAENDPAIGDPVEGGDPEWENMF